MTQYPGLIRGAPAPKWLPRGGIEHVLEVKEREGLTWSETAIRFGTTMNAIKAASRRRLLARRNA